MPLALLAHSPFRRVDWRWVRAARLAELDSEPGPQDDEATVQAVHYQRELLRKGKNRQCDRLRRSCPKVHAARQLEANGGATRVIVQARRLAAQTPQEIATLTTLTPAVVSMYAALFYDVRDNLRATDWIVARAIGR